MSNGEKLTYLDFDLYSRRISFFYQNKEKLGSTFGFILTIIYGITSIILFIIYSLNILKRKELTIIDTKIYPDELPSFSINANNLYLSFGLEHPEKFTRFIDESIYYPEVVYIERIKENGKQKISYQSALNVERCDKLKFGKNYQNLVKNEDLNNSYCLKDFNLTLKGGFKYDKMSYIRINIYPCQNNSKNNNHCKSQTEIDKYLKSGYFSALVKDIGLNPFNYSHPIIPAVQDLYTTIDKYTQKEFIIYFGITHIETDVGLFTNVFKKEDHLKYINHISNIFFINNEEYFDDKLIFSAQIRLEDIVYFQKREYTKMYIVFSTTGGFMQVIYTILGLFAILTKKFNLEKKLLNSLFNFNIKQKKIILSIEYDKKLGYNSDKGKENNFIPYEAKKSNLTKKNRARRNSIFLFDKNHHNMLPKMKKNEKETISMGMKEMKNFNNNRSEEEIEDIIKQAPKKNPQNQNIVNLSKANMIDKSNISDLNINKIFEQKNIYGKNIDFTLVNEVMKYEKGNCAIIDFTIFDYYCLRKIRRKKTEIELFNFGINFYKRQMDIINFFNIILLTQIKLNSEKESMSNKPSQKNNRLSQAIELSIK